MTRAVTRISDQISEELASLERRAVLAAKKLTSRLRVRATGAAARGAPPKLGGELKQFVSPILRDAMVAAHLSAVRRSQLIYQQQGAKLKPSKVLQLDGVFDAVVERLVRQMGVPTSKITALQKQYDTRALKVVDKVSANVEKRLRQATLDLVKEGAHTKDAVETMGREFDKLGVGREDYQLEAIFRTQSQLAYNAGRYDADQDPAVQEILWGYEYVTVGDDRVRPAHQELEGATFEKDDPALKKLWPPNGWNCRCQLIPIFDEPDDPQEAPDDAEPDKGFGFSPADAFGARGFGLCLT